MIKLHPDMIAAIRRGEKTETRRPMRPQPYLEAFKSRLYGFKPCDWPQIWRWDGEGLEHSYNWGIETTPHAPTIAQYAPLGRVGCLRPIAYPDGRLTDISVLITDIRAERLPAISPAGLRAEGFSCLPSCPDLDDFIYLWNGIYSAPLRFYYAPWVWVYTFRVVEITLEEPDDRWSGPASLFNEGRVYMGFPVANPDSRDFSPTLKIKIDCTK